VSAQKTGGVGPAVAGGLAKGAQGLAAMAGKRMLSVATDKIGDTTQRLVDYTASGGGSGLLSAVTGRGGNGGGKGKTLKVTNIVEWIDVGVPVRLAYDQWTRFTDFPSFMKKVESVEQDDEDDTKLRWKAQIFLSHREWESTIIEQVPDRRIVWSSEGAKGSVDGAVTFHEVGPDLTRICLNLQYYPQGFFERMGNVWRAQGRRARLELKHYARHVMNESVLHPDEVKGWRGEIRDGEVVKDDEQARSEEEQQQGGDDGGGESNEPSSMEERRRARDSRGGEERGGDRPRRGADEDDRQTRRPGRGREEPRKVASRRQA
jgi:uncharacterized membrane protein